MIFPQIYRNNYLLYSQFSTVFEQEGGKMMVEYSSFGSMGGW